MELISVGLFHPIAATNKACHGQLTIHIGALIFKTPHDSDICLKVSPGWLMHNVGVEVDQRPKKQYNDLSSPYVAYVEETK